MTSSTDQHPNAQREGEIPAPLPASEQDCLRCIAGHMIPASAAHDVPGADDPAIFANMVASVRRDKQALSRTLQFVDRAAGGRLADLPRVEQSLLLERLRASDPGVFTVVEAVVSRSYYRDDRVLRSIGMDARPPYPDGYDVSQGDWSLLDPVRKRTAMYRDAG